jgi:multiple sugar transport system permease protein
VTNANDRAAIGRGPARRGSGRGLRAFAPIPWLLPALALIAFVVVWPVVAMVRTSFQKIDASGFIQGAAGLLNFSTLFHEQALPQVLIHTVIWVVAVVGLTMLLSLGISVLLNQVFPGRAVVRTLMVVPWAASVMMTAIVFRWMLNPQNGAVNLVLHHLGLLSALNSTQADWLGQPDTALCWMIAVGVFVSVPFTSVTLLAGLQAISPDIYDAAAVDGAAGLRGYLTITLPLLRPAILVSLLINAINVLNSFPIIWEMTRGGPGYETATTTIFMYQLKASNIGEASAMSVCNLALVAVMVVAILRFTNWKEQLAQ